MKRVSILFLAFGLAGASLVVGTSPASAASSTPCSDHTTTGMGTKKTGSGHGGMDMNSGNKSMGSKTKSSKHSCPTVAGAREVSMMGDAFAFAPMTISAAAGEDITIALTADDIAHDVYVEGVGHVVHAKAGKTAMGGLRITEPGTYRFWCTEKGHKKAGMTGMITVT